MVENFSSSSPDTHEVSPIKESASSLRVLFDEAERVLETKDSEGGREKAKACLPKIYAVLQGLNKSDLSDWTRVWVWNKEGDLTEVEFNELNLRRKLLSNAVGILTASGEIRHGLNEI
ncbi:MAG: hypothetical protein WC880_03840 [Candidatus Paceibacterota bacterium]